MGYFANGTEAEVWAEANCLGCVHNKADTGCPITLAHLLYNYRDCNDPDSILHMLVPRSEDGMTNEECTMFHLRPTDRCLNTHDMFGED